MDWLDADGGATRQAHIRIGSRTNADGSTRADEVLETGRLRDLCAQEPIALRG